ncbi:MAG TPA: hypothetical protein VMU39_26020 [Solirubrobacteraceae bacterium]|nr:hypothetical protein [Solirubrobacteraceae bacterium]
MPVPAELPQLFKRTATAIQRQAQTELDQQRAAQLDALLTKSIVALGISAGSSRTPRMSCARRSPSNARSSRSRLPIRT